MVDFLNNILLVKNGDPDIWMQVLVYIIFAVLWAVGAISKKVQKEQQQKNLQKQPERPVNQTEKIPQIAESIFSKLQRALNPPEIEYLKKSQSEEKKVKLPTAATVKKVSATKPASAQHPQDQSVGYRQEIIESLTTDSDSLKKAILYHEILGKPVGLRDLV